MSDSSHTTDNVPKDVAALRDLYPSWTFGVSYAVAGSGPDGRALWAKRGDLKLTGGSAGELVGKIENLSGPGV